MRTSPRLTGLFRGFGDGRSTTTTPIVSNGLCTWQGMLVTLIAITADAPGHLSPHAPAVTVEDTAMVREEPVGPGRLDCRGAAFQRTTALRHEECLCLAARAHPGRYQRPNQARNLSLVPIGHASNQR